MSLGAQIATFPLGAARFGVSYLLGLVAGPIPLSLTAAVLRGALAWIVVFVVPWPFLHDLGAQTFGILYQVIQRTAAVFGSAPGAPVGQEACHGQLPSLWPSRFSRFSSCLYVVAPGRSQGRRRES